MDPHERFHLIFSTLKSPVSSLTLLLCLFSKRSTIAKITLDIQQMFKEVAHLPNVNVKYKQDAAKKRRKKKFVVADMVIDHFGKGRTLMASYSNLQDRRLDSLQMDD